MLPDVFSVLIGSYSTWNRATLGRFLFQSGTALEAPKSATPRWGFTCLGDALFNSWPLSVGFWRFRKGKVPTDSLEAYPNVSESPERGGEPFTCPGADSPCLYTKSWPFSVSFWRISKKDPRKGGRYPSRGSDRRCVIYFVSKFPAITCKQMSIWLFFPCFCTKSWPFSVGCWRFRKKDPPVTGKLPLFFHTEGINLRHMFENERYPSPLGRFRKGKVLTESLESYPNVSGSPQPAPSRGKENKPRSDRDLQRFSVALSDGRCRETAEAAVNSALQAAFGRGVAHFRARGLEPFAFWTRFSGK